MPTVTVWATSDNLQTLTSKYVNSVQVFSIQNINQYVFDKPSEARS